MFEQGHVPEPQTAAEGFNAGEVIIGHVSNSSREHPLIHLPTIFGIDMSVTKHVFMLWLVAAALFLIVTAIVRRYVRQERLVPTGAANVLELVVEFIRDGVVRPNVGGKWTEAWTPFLLTMFLFILGANLIGLIPIFDVIGLVDHYVLHTAEGSFVKRLIHGSSTATGNFNVTAGLAVVTFFAIILAGTRVHGFVKHWANLVPHGLPKPLYVLLIPMEIIGMLVRPFALTMRLAANMTGGHIAILAIMSFVFIFAESLGATPAIGIGLGFSLPLSVGVSGLEIIVVLVQAYVFTLLSAVFIGMAIHAHH
ncbi:MAG: F0F1 ATP synthase subunit A [Acidobacteria bacterium]|nr:F0F1 ATP synthase subunit A [Acidobacteriota bacterium]